MSVIIYGASDDLIEVEGDIREEFYALEEPTNYIGLSNGSVVSITYDDDGFWRIRPIAVVDSVIIRPARGDDEPADADGCPGYSDKAEITGDIRWVLHAGGKESLARRRKENA